MCKNTDFLRSSLLRQALTLLDYLLKTGSERVAQQSCENAFTIQVPHFPKHGASRLRWGPMLRSRPLFSSFSPPLIFHRRHYVIFSTWTVMVETRGPT